MVAQKQTWAKMPRIMIKGGVWKNTEVSLTWTPTNICVCFVFNYQPTFPTSSSCSVTHGWLVHVPLTLYWKTGIEL